MGMLALAQANAFRIPLADESVHMVLTCQVSRALGRSSVGLDLSFTYLRDQARKRLSLDKLAEWKIGRAKSNGHNLGDLPLFATTDVEGTQ